jgi:hypothetical protein
VIKERFLQVCSNTCRLSVASRRATTNREGAATKAQVNGSTVPADRREPKSRTGRLKRSAPSGARCSANEGHCPRRAR